MITKGNRNDGDHKSHFNNTVPLKHVNDVLLLREVDGLGVKYLLWAQFHMEVVQS